MRRTNSVSTKIEELRSRINESERRKNELITGLQKLKDKCVSREISYYDYEQIIKNEINGKNTTDWIHYYDKFTHNCKEILEKEERKKFWKKMFSFLLLGIIGIVLIFSMFNSPTLLGFAAKEKVQKFTQSINQEFAQNAIYQWNLDNVGTLSSVKLSGFIEGEGEVKVYLDDILVLDSSKINSKKTSRSITGMGVEGEEPSIESQPSNSEEEKGAVQTEVGPSQQQPPASSDTSPQLTETPSTQSPQESQPSNSEEEKGAVQNEVGPSQESPSASSDAPFQSTQTSPIQESQTSNSEEEKGAVQTEVGPSQQQPPALSENETSDTNQTQEIILKEFSNICQDTCDLEKLLLNKSSYNLRIELSNAKLSLSEINYELLQEGQTALSENITEFNITDTNLTDINITEVNITGTNQTTINITEVNITESNLTEANITLSENISSKTWQYKAVINKPTKWIKVLDRQEIENTKNSLVKIPKQATNISIKTGKEVQDSLLEIEEYNQIIENSDGNDLISGSITGNVALDIKEGSGLLTRLLNWMKGLTLTGNVIQEEALQDKITETQDSKIVDLDEIVNVTPNEDIAIEYYTQGPIATEEETPNGKIVRVSGSDELNFTDILAFSQIQEIFPIEQKSNIRIKWVEENTYVNFTAEDLDNNGKIDYLEWIVPHLSNQTFEIILITKAEHLDENRSFISDIYEQVKERDGNWSEQINESEYVRVTFERNLTNQNDITLYAKSALGAQIEVYEKDKNKLIATFENVSSEGWYKVYLNNLSECYDNKTEILTENGWKLFSKLNREEKIATLNNKTKEVEWQKPSDYQTFDYNGEMYKIVLEDGSELVVSPEHKVYSSSTYLNKLSGCEMNLNGEIINSLPLNSESLTCLSNFDNSENVVSINGEEILNTTIPKCSSGGNNLLLRKCLSNVSIILDSDLDIFDNCLSVKPNGHFSISYPSSDNNSLIVMGKFSSERNLSLFLEENMFLFSDDFRGICQNRKDSWFCNMWKIALENFLNTNSCSEQFHNLPDHNSCSFESRGSTTNLSVYNNIRVNLNSHDNINKSLIFKVYDNKNSFGLNIASYPSDFKNINNFFFTFLSKRNLSFEGNIEFGIISTSCQICSILQSCLNMLSCKRDYKTCENLFDWNACSNHLQDLPNHDSCALESGLAMADISVYNNILVNLYSHNIPDNSDIYKDFALQTIKEVYSKINSGKGVYFLNFENKPVKVKSIEKEQYNSKIYDVDVPNDIVLVKRNNSTGFWSGNSNNYSQDTFDLKIIGNPVEFDYILDPTVLIGTANQSSSNNNITTEPYPLSHITLNDSSLALYLPFDVPNTLGTNRTYDYSTNNNDCTLTGTDSGAGWNSTAGQPIGSMQFNENTAGGYLSCGTGASLNTFGKNYTVSAWIYLKNYNGDTTNGYSTYIIGRGTTTTGWTFTVKGMASSPASTQGKLQLQHVGGTNAFNWTISNVPRNVWTHVAATYNTNGTVSFYFNGTLDVSRTGFGAQVNAGTQTTYIGVDSRDAVGYEFNGTIDEVMVFNRTLTATEITAIYNNQTYRFKTPASQEFPGANFTAGDNRVNVTYNATLVPGTNIQLRLREYEGGTATTNTSWQALTNGNNQLNTFNIASTTNNLTLEFNFSTDQYNFYSPILSNSIVITTWTAGETDTIYPIFSTYWDDNSTLLDNGIAKFNVTLLSTNGTVFLQINNTNYTALNVSASVYNVSVNLSGGVYPYYWISWGNGSSHNYNISEVRYYTVNATPDTAYPTFSTYWDDNSTLVGNGIAKFNVTLASTNGTVFLQINNTNYTALNLTASVYNVSVSLTNGTYPYYWISWGNGTSHNYNISGVRYYTINATPLPNEIITEPYPLYHLKLNDTSLALYLPFDVPNTLGTNITYDYSTNNNDCTLTGTDSGAGWNSTAGQPIGSMQFNENIVNGYLSCGTGASLNTFGKNYTVSAWIYMKNYNGDATNGYANFILGRTGASYPNSGYAITVGGPPSADFRKMRLEHFASGYYINASNADVPLNRWVHIAVVYNNNTNQVSYYFNATLDSTKNTPAQTNAGTIPFYIGIDSRDVVGYEFNGTIDEVMVFNRTLTATEITNIYNGQFYRYNSPANKTFDGYNLSQNGTLNRINVTLNSTLLNSVNLSLRLIEFNSSGANVQNSSWVNVISGNNVVQTFTINTTIYNVSVDFNFSSDSYNFYSPVLSDSIVITTWTAGETDTIYPIFSTYWDNNATLVTSGIAKFNVTLASTNGTVFLQINNTNYTALNISASVYNVSVNLSAGVYPYYWISWGNGTSHNYNISSVRYYTVNETSANTAPQIISVSSINNTDPTENGVANIIVNFSVYDANGASDLNNASAMINFTKEGEPLRSNLTCLQVQASGNYANYSCTVGMWYFDLNGNWNVTAFINDTAGANSLNSTTYFQYNLLQAIVISPNQLSFNVNIGSKNQTSTNDPTTINNTGNYNITNITVKAVNIYGERDSSYFINSANFSVSTSTGADVECSLSSTIASTLSNGTDIQIVGAATDRGNLSSGAGQEQIYYCLREVPNTISSQTYSTTNGGSWTIRILIIALLPRLRRKKKIEEEPLMKSLNLMSEEIKSDYSQEKSKIINLLIQEIKKKYRISNKELNKFITSKTDISIPITIFSKEIGGLEVIVKFMKENLTMSYAEIAHLLDRDERTIWTSYNKAIKKDKTPITITDCNIYISIELFRDRALTVLELLIVYLKEQGMKFSEIAKLLDRDQRNIWTIYSNASTKLNNSNSIISLLPKPKIKKAEEELLMKSLNLMSEEIKSDYSQEKSKIVHLLIQEIKKKYRISNKQISEFVESKRDIEIPITIFSKEIGGLEVVVKFMKENLNMNYHEIAGALQRDERTIWTAYNKAIEKDKTPIKVEDNEITISVELLRNRNFTVFEIIISSLKEQGMKFSEIAKLLDRDQRNIWTIYSNACVKQDGSN